MAKTHLASPSTKTIECWNVARKYIKHSNKLIKNPIAWKCRFRKVFLTDRYFMKPSGTIRLVNSNAVLRWCIMESTHWKPFESHRVIALGSRKFTQKRLVPSSFEAKTIGKCHELQNAPVYVISVCASSSRKLICRLKPWLKAFWQCILSVNAVHARSGFTGALCKYGLEET